MKNLSHMEKIMEELKAGTWKNPPPEEYQNNFDSIYLDMLTMYPKSDKKINIDPSIILKSRSNGKSKLNKRMQPIEIKDLKLEQTHFDFYLKVTVISGIVMIAGSSMMFLIKTEEGEVTKVCLYNFEKYYGLKTRDELETLFIKDKTKLIIVNPHFKYFLDGEPGIRIEEPEEVLIFNGNEGKNSEEEMNAFIKNLPEIPYDELKKSADNFMKEKKYEEAIDEYKYLIKVHGGNTIVYSNISEACLKTKSFLSASIYSKLSLDMDPNNIKSMYRHLRALYGLGQFKEAFEFYNKLESKQFKEFPEVIKLIEEIKRIVENTENK